MPESGVTKHNYLFCQFVNPARGHEGDRCDCFDTPSQRRTTLAKQRLARLRANCEITRASTSNDPESAVASDPAVTRCPSSCTLSSSPLVIQPSPSQLPSMIISALEPILDNLPVTDEDYSAVAAIRFLEIHGQLKESRPVLVRSKKTHSIALAPDLIPVKNLDHIPAQFQKYRIVFSEQASYRLPQHQPWDHPIDLKPDTDIKKRGIYRLTPAENLALKEYIDDHLKKGYIRPSTSPLAVPLFFIAKRGGGALRPIQDYRAINDITIKNAAPLPLIPELIDKLQGSRYFTKFDVRWGYNNIRIRKGDEWKAAFKCSLGLFEPLVMTFGLCNA